MIQIGTHISLEIGPSPHLIAMGRNCVTASDHCWLATIDRALSEEESLGPLSHDKHRGILLHPTIAVTPERLCLGVIDTYHWSGSALNHWEDR